MVLIILHIITLYTMLYDYCLEIYASLIRKAVIKYVCKLWPFVIYRSSRSLEACDPKL
jgi:hypothetical protein